MNANLRPAGRLEPASSNTSQEPRRVFAGPDVFALQFAAQGIMGSVFIAFQWGFQPSGPIFFLPWLLGAAFQISVGIAIAELSSAYSTGGSCYSWVRDLVGETPGVLVGYLLLLGYIAWLANIDSSVSPYLLSLLGVSSPSHSVVVLTCLVLLCVQSLVNVGSMRFIRAVIQATMLVQVLAIAVVTVALLAAGLHNGLSFLAVAHWTGVHEHIPPFLTLIVSMGTILFGLDVGANASADVSNPRHMVPRGSVAAHLATYICGTLFIAVPLLALSNIDRALAAPYPLQYILQTRIGLVFANTIEAVALITLCIAGVVVQYAATRLITAQARDHMLPRRLSRLNGAGRPQAAVLATAVVVAVLVLRSDVLTISVVIGGTILPLVYGITVAVSLYGKRRGLLSVDRAWNLGRWGVFNDCLALAWSLPLTAFCFLFFNVSYAVTGGVVSLAIVALMYVAWALPHLNRSRSP